MRYIIEDKEDGKSCFYAENDGIYRKIYRDGRWGEGRRIYNHPVKDFCVKNDANNIMHIICINKNGDIIYIKNDGESHTLIKANERVSARHLMMYEYNCRISLIYTASYGEDIMLIYCILGMNAMPVTIDSGIKSEQFFLYNNRVYYQNSYGVLGYKDFADGRPDSFIPLADNSESAYIINYCGRDIMLYKNPAGIVCGDNVVIDDKYAKNPIISIRNEKLLLIWESGDFIRYAESDDGGSSFHTPMRFFNNASPMEIYKIQSGDNFIYEYASEREHNIRLFAEKNADTGEGRIRNHSVHTSRETEKLAIMTQMMKSDIAELKSRVERIEKFLENKEQ